jgi:hypothetical protein
LPQARPSPLSAAALPRPPTHRTSDIVFARATLTMNLGISWSPIPPKWAGKPASGQDRRRGVSTERPQWRIRVCERPVGAASDRQVPTTTERCSDRESVLGRSRLSGRTSRYSHDLFPLRGLPIQPLGLRPPLMCLLCRESRRLTARCLVVLRHFRVSIRPDLGATPRSGSSLLGVCNLFRSPPALEQSQANL